MPPTTVHYHKTNLTRSIPDVNFLTEYSWQVIIASEQVASPDVGRQFIGSIAMSRHFQTFLNTAVLKYVAELSVLKEDPR